MHLTEGMTAWERLKLATATLWPERLHGIRGSRAFAAPDDDRPEPREGNSTNTPKPARACACPSWARRDRRSAASWKVRTSTSSTYNPVDSHHRTTYGAAARWVTE